MKTINLWFQPIKKTTCDCGEKKTEVWAWGKYIRNRWHTINHFCQKCFADRVLRWVNSNTSNEFTFNPRMGYSLPDWLRKIPPHTTHQAMKLKTTEKERDDYVNSLDWSDEGNRLVKNMRDDLDVALAWVKHITNIAIVRCPNE